MWHVWRLGCHPLKTRLKWTNGRIYIWKQRSQGGPLVLGVPVEIKFSSSRLGLKARVEFHTSQQVCIGCPPCPGLCPQGQGSKRTNWCLRGGYAPSGGGKRNPEGLMGQERRKSDGGGRGAGSLGSSEKGSLEMWQLSRVEGSEGADAQMSGTVPGWMLEVEATARGVCWHVPGQGAASGLGGRERVPGRRQGGCRVGLCGRRGRSGTAQ